MDHASPSRHAPIASAAQGQGTSGARLDDTGQRSRLKSAWEGLRSRIHHVRAFVWPDVVLLRGVTADGKSLSILRAGNAEPSAAYFFSGHVLKQLTSERPLGREWLWAVPTAARRHGCAFVLFRVTATRATLARRILRANERAFHLPLSIGAVVDVSDPSRLLRSESLRADVRRVRRRQFTFRISRSAADLDTFRRCFHDPHVASVHGFDAIGMDLSRLLASCADGAMPEPWVLLKVELQDEWVGACLLADAPDWAALMELGVRDGDPGHVKRGVLQAAYWLSIEHLRSQGHRRVSLMYARPFLGSGVLQYKLKFGPSLRPKVTPGFLLTFDPDSETAREILLREPLLVQDGKTLRAVWFAADAEASPDPSSVPARRLALAGVTGVDRVVLGHLDDATAKRIRENDRGAPCRVCGK